MDTLALGPMNALDQGMQHWINSTKMTFFQSWMTSSDTAEV